MTLVTDNGPNFVSNEFETFLSKNGIRHITSAPYHPSTNGQAENTVKSFKSFLRHRGEDDWKIKLDKFLFQYRVTPHTTTGVAPSELMIGRRLRTVLDLVHPSKLLPNSVASQQDKQKYYHDGKSRRSFDLGGDSPVMVRNYSHLTKDRWVPAQVMEQTGPLSYKCTLPTGQVVRRHQDQMLSRTLPDTPIPKPVSSMSNQSSLPNVVTPNSGSPVQSTTKSLVSTPKSSTPLRKSSRAVKPPVRLDL